MTLEIKERRELLERRLRAVLGARNNLIDFARLMKPIAGHDADPDYSGYQVAKHHAFLAKQLERVASGDARRLIVNMPPRAGKSELSSKIFPAWLAGMHPDKSLILATYNERFALDFGRAVRSYMRSAPYEQIFPNSKIKKGAAAANRVEMTDGGLLVFTGVGGSLTGRGGDCLVAGTEISTPDGIFPIEAITVEMSVLAFDEDDQRCKFKSVQAVACRGKANIYAVSTASGRVIEATGDHKFYTKNRGWVEARFLTVSDVLLRLGTVDGVSDAVSSITDTRREATVYDIQVEDCHNFFANEILVHNCIICDDLIKDRQQADSQLERDNMWNWFNQVLKTRLMTDKGAIMIITTRWHPDDVVGRLTDPTNSYYDEGEASQWEIVDLPALAYDDDVLGRKVGEPLWPERFGRDFLNSMKASDPRGFSALYQCRPAPEDGVHFQADWLSEYRSPKDIPNELRYYMSADFAVSEGSKRDKSCVLVVGLDSKQNIWIMPDSWWGQGTSDVVVERTVSLIAKYKPLTMWGEKGQLAKSLGPFLRKRMVEKQAFCAIDETHPIADKVARSQSIAGRMAANMVMFPAYAPWWPLARDQILKFPQVSHDDFVDALSLVGLGLMRLTTPRQQAVSREIKAGTFKWLKETTKRQTRMISMSRGIEGW